MSGKHLTALAALTLALAASPAALGAEITFACGSTGIQSRLCDEAAKAWSAKTGNTVKVVAAPQSTSEQLALYQQFLTGKSSDIDVFQVDVIWPGILGSHFIDLKQQVDQATIDQYFPSIVEGLTRDGQLLALPWYTDAGLLYYRQDLLDKYKLKVPATWAELTEAARTIQEGERKAGNDRFYGFVFQGRAYEGLTCDALEWIASFGGGSIVGPDGKITVDNPQAAKALDTAASWIGTIAPDGVLNYMEEDARGVFQSGNAAFMRNWPYAASLAEAGDSPVKGKVGYAPLPKGDGEGGRNAATLGGWQIAVSKYSRSPKEATAFAVYLTSRDEQKRRALEGGYQPTIPALYEDAEILAKRPFFKVTRQVLDSAVARPSAVTGERYSEVSSLFWNAVHSTLSKQGDAAANLAQLQKDLNRLSRGGRW
ncbi:ABC transporter substrate-binding protein [Inquilinus limosus]|uniref:ABC transporter substrate-binding protein n=1 Tax=Inquilinus limosus TaxID=171674 RepID=A0A211YU77_9PROT|nr:ABC transporter substrate-binding protein [Inquilinus limosus]OWJ56526.1 ABC transporter substrate-binding protein [Inquilinus limosus]